MKRRCLREFWHFLNRQKSGPLDSKLTTPPFASRARCRNDALRKAIGQITEERDRLAHDNRILKAGVCSLNAKREQLVRQLDETSHILHDLTARHQDLERAVAMHNMQVGACRRDETSHFYGGGGSDDGDVF